METLEKLIAAYDLALKQACSAATETLARKSTETSDLHRISVNEAYAKTFQLRDELKSRIGPGEANVLEKLSHQVSASHYGFHDTNGRSRSAEQHISTITEFLGTVREWPASQ